ncbi:uncharacterized protein LOC113274095 [Papaver somniferum]|uniref:uncharacterized protein LOC113274095 n=1 Tax=Papaver somniferum TaxID=3469 RepID=UPI000E704971|nr:uncharacterized protein LOC113274095 [Papaver somniferum]
MSLFEMPSSVINKLEKIMRDFLWNDNKGKRKIHPIKWRALCRKKKYGGLGIKNLKMTNQSLLSKWSWRYANEDDVLWKKIVDEKYGVGDVFWTSKMPKCIYGRSVWRAIMKSNCIFLKYVRFKVNNGSLFIWSLKCPHKVGFFLWIIAHERLPTRDMMLRRRIDVPVNCLFCSATETTPHLLLHCEFTRKVWDFLSAKLKWLFAMPMDTMPALQA